MEREPLGLTTWASHEAVTRNARQAGDRPLNTGPEPHLRHQSNLQMVESLIPCALVSHGPLVAVDAQLGGVGEVGAELEEERAEVGVHAVEVEEVDERRRADQPGIAAAGRRAVAPWVRHTPAFSCARPTNSTPSSS